MGRLLDLWLDRDIVVWEPALARAPWRVVWAHDGQNLFRDESAYGGCSWGLGQVMTDLMLDGVIPPTLVVGVANTSERLREYQPGEGGDGYLRWLVDDLRPAIFERFPVSRAAEDQFLLGSSMGGLISAYALCRYPQAFAGAACLSTHWPAGAEFLWSGLSAAGRHRWYFDYGAGGADAAYGPYQERVDELFEATGQEFRSLFFPGHDHCERDWRERVHLPLGYLLG